MEQEYHLGAGYSGMNNDDDIYERNEKMMWEQYHISKMDDGDFDLREIKEEIG